MYVYGQVQLILLETCCELLQLFSRQWHSVSIATET